MSRKRIATLTAEKAVKQSMIRKRIQALGLEAYKVELRNDLLEAMDYVLTPKEKNMMVLYFDMDGLGTSMSYAKIAAALKVSTPCVTQQIYRAIARLSYYDKWWYNHDPAELALFNPRFHKYGTIMM